MFLFATDCKVGSQFLRGPKKDGLPQGRSTSRVCGAGLLVSWGFAAPSGGGLRGGALTQSAVIGVAQDAIGNLPGLSPDQTKEQENLVAVGYAVTYPLGTILCAMVLANVLPRLYRRDLAAESAQIAKEMDAPSDNPDLHEGYYEIVLRAYTIQRPDLVGRTIEDFENQQKALGHRIYLTRIRRDGKILDHTQQTALLAGDVVAVSALRGSLVDFDARTHIGPETDDVELLGYQTETLHVVASEKAQMGKTIAELRAEPFMVGVYIDKLFRSGTEFPYRLSTPVERGDTLILSGAKRLVDPAGKAIGKPVPTSFATDMIWVGLGIFLGGCLGIPALTAGGVPISLSTSGGALIMGLVFGWIRGKYPTYGNVPPGAQWFMDTLGLCLFVAVVGINAGPSFTSGLATAGWGLLLFGARPPVARRPPAPRSEPAPRRKGNHRAGDHLQPRGDPVLRAAQPLRAEGQVHSARHRRPGRQAGPEGHDRARHAQRGPRQPELDRHRTARGLLRAGLLRSGGVPAGVDR